MRAFYSVPTVLPNLLATNLSLLSALVQTEPVTTSPTPGDTGCPHTATSGHPHPRAFWEVQAQTHRGHLGLWRPFQEVEDEWSLITCHVE